MPRLTGPIARGLARAALVGTAARAAAETCALPGPTARFKAPDAGHAADPIAMPPPGKGPTFWGGEVAKGGYRVAIAASLGVTHCGPDPPEMPHTPQPRFNAV